MFPGMLQLPPKAGSGEEPMEIEPEEMPMHEEMESAVSISPESVSYRSEQQVCANCQYMEADGNCVALKMPVAPGDGCNLFSEGGM